MSLMRRSLVRENDPPRGVSVATHSRDYAAGSRIPLHCHGSDQLVFASRGVMEVRSGQRFWIIPPFFGLWIPARVEHEIYMPGPVSMRTLYLRPALTQLDSGCAVLSVGPLMRELIIEIVRTGQLRKNRRTERAMRDLLVAELSRAGPVPTVVTLPRDSRAAAIAHSVLAEPAHRMPLKSMCAAAGVGIRSLQRIFQREVGIDFERWRRQVRLIRAVELLVEGRSVKEAACLVGYQQPSAFVATFRSVFGATPKAWITALNRGRSST